MFEKLNDMLCEPANTTPEQREINEREWMNPDNWHGWICPYYKSDLDTRPFVPGRMLHPKIHVPTWLCPTKSRPIPNRGQSRGKIWSLLAWTTVILISIIWLFAMLNMSLI